MALAGDRRVALHRCLFEPNLISDNVVSSHYERVGGVSEYFIAVQTDPVGDFNDTLESLNLSLLEAYRSHGLSPETHLFSRFFFSNIREQKSALMASEAFDLMRHGACSFVEQAPLNGGPLTLLTCHLRSAHGFKRRIQAFDSCHQATSLLGRNYGLHYVLNICSGVPGGTSLQTDQLFRAYDRFLATQNMTVRRNTARTWLYVSDIDCEYGEMVNARRAFFETCGLTPDTHYIASTGIEGGTDRHDAHVSMDALAIENLSPRQVSFLQAPEHLNPTHEYGVTFERGTRIQFGDRTHYYISGTASIDKYGRVLHKGDVRAQTERTIENINALLASDQLCISDMSYLIVYLRNSGDYHLVQETLRERVDREIPQVIVSAKVCRPSWLVEIEAFGVADASTDFPPFY